MRLISFSKNYGKRKTDQVRQHILPKRWLNFLPDKTRAVIKCDLTLSRTTILDSSNLKEFADDNSKFDENGREFHKKSRKHCEKQRNCSLRAISHFSTVYSKDLCDM